MSNANMTSASIVLSQRNLTNTKFIERFVSGSLQLIGTDIDGTVTTYDVSRFTSLRTGSTYPITASWAANATSASYALNSGGTSITTGSTYPITSSWANNVAGGLSSSFNYISASTIYGQTASFYSLLLNTSVTVPSTTNDAGINGEVRIDANFMYIYSGGAWKRMILSTW